MSHCDSDSGLSISLDGSHYGVSVGPKIEVKIPDLNIKRTLSVSSTVTIGTLKKGIINSLPSDLKDSINFGLFIPPTAGKAGKFLLEERSLQEYGLNQDNSQIELRYKRRLYRTSNLNVARLKKLHSKANLKVFMDYVGGGDVCKVTKMLNKGLDPNYQLKETGETPLIKACSLGRSGEMVKTLVEGGAHLDFRHSNGHTPLHAAAILGNLEAVKIILDLGQSPNTVDLEGLTPLYHSTISTAGIACAERLLFDYAVIGIEDENGLQEIHQACRFGHVQHLELLLQYKADINSQTSKNGNTPLHICAYLNQESCARLLLFRGADRTVTNRSGHTPYHQALLSDNKSLAILIQYYKDEDVVLMKPMAKYNEKRKSSVAPTEMIHRSRSASGLSEQSQLEMREDSGFISQGSSFPVPGHTRSRTRSIGKLQGTQMDNLMKEDSSSLQANKRFSRSFNNLNQKSTNKDSEPIEPDQSSNGWAPDWEREDNDDTISSVSGPSQRKAARKKDKKKCRSHSSSRRSSKGDLPGLVEMDTRFLPRIVVLQKNTQGFGFVIRGLKASSGISFVPMPSNPALQYFEDVEPMSVADRAGITKGDFILDINNQSVVSSSHEETVRLIKASGDILAMKVVTVNKSHCQEKSNYWVDQDMSSMDDASDISSIVSSDIRPLHHLSTFSRSMTRPPNTSSAVSDHYSTLGAPPSATFSGMHSSTPHYKHGHTVTPTSYFSPNIPMTDSMNSIAVRIQRNHISIPTTRPDSISSIESFYPMPPPPSIDFCPKESRIDEECMEDPSLRRQSGQSQMASYLPNDDPTNPLAVASNSNHVRANVASVIPPPPPPPPCTAPPPPCAAPPPPCAAPPPPCAAPHLPTQQAPKPILKPPKPTVNLQQEQSNASSGFDNHLRDAIARRREKIDNDQSSLASFDSADDSSRQHIRTTLSSLKQNNQYSRVQSNRWPNIPCPKDPPTNGTMFQRTNSDVFSNTSNSANRKADENTSRLYLV